MIILPKKITDNENTGAWITCFLMAACAVMPVITIVTWGTGGGNSWFCEFLCIVAWAGLFWWTGQPLMERDAAAYAIEDAEEQGEEGLSANIFAGSFSVKKIGLLLTVWLRRMVQGLRIYLIRHKVR